MRSFLNGRGALCARHHAMPRGGGHHGFGHGRHHDEGRGGRRRAFEGGELQLVLLKLLAEQPRHGYDLIRAIEERTGGAYAPSPGVVYPMLSMLEELGQIEKAGDEGTRKAFTATADGTARLETEKDTVAAVFAKLDALAARRERTDGAPIRRAMDNLRAVLMHRLGREGVETETIHAAAAILDEAAQRIERLP